MNAKEIEEKAIIKVCDKILDFIQDREPITKATIVTVDDILEIGHKMMEEVDVNE